MKRIICLLLIPLFAHAAENLVEINMEGTSTAEQEPSARAQITREVLDKTAEKFIFDLIGEKKAQANKAVVQSIVKQSSKFVPFVKGGELQKTPEGFKMAVNLKVSPADLRELLTKEGLLYESESGTIALPMIAVLDQTRGSRYMWWLENPDSSKAQLMTLEKRLETSLREEFAKKGFFTLKPATSNLFEMVPLASRTESLRVEDMGQLAEFFKAQMVLVGQISIENSSRFSNGTKAVMKVAAHQSQTGRFVAEVARSIELENGSLSQVINKKLAPALDDLGRDLSAQVLDAWKRGTFGSELLKLSVMAKFDSKQLDQFKTQLAKSITQLRNVRERLFEPGRITFEVDASGSAADLANRLRSAQLEGFQLQVSDVEADRVSIQVKTR